jgi:hypothetical protein
MGFLLAPLGVAMLFASVVGFRIVYKEDWTGLYEAITGFGLGGSAIALFGRVGGGIYTKARACAAPCATSGRTPHLRAASGHCITAAGSAWRMMIRRQLASALPVIPVPWIARRGRLCTP